MKKGLFIPWSHSTVDLLKTLCKERNLCFRVVFNNSAVLDTDEKGSSMLFKSGRQLNRRWGLTSAVGSIITALPHTLTHETDPVWSSSVYTKHRDGAGQCIQICLCLSVSKNTTAHTHKHTKRCCGQTHPSLGPHLENPKPKLMPLFFNYLSSHHRHHTRSIYILPQSLFFPFSPISNVSMCCHHKHTPTCTRSHAPQSGNHNKHTNL